MTSDLLDFVFQALRIAVPYTLAALAGTLCERSGVVNIALEGLMLGGAFGFAVGSLTTGSPLAGLLFGALAGMLLASVHGVASVIFRAEQIVSGLAINLLAVGVTRVLLQRLYHSASNSPRALGIEPLWRESAMSAFLTHPLVWLTLVLVGGMVWMFQKTVLGLHLTAVGEHPRAARSAGLEVERLQLLAVLGSGLLAGLAGVWLASDQHQFSDQMSGGRGYIALAAMIFGRWRPGPASAACLLFGVAEALQLRLQGGGGGIPGQFIQALPYVVTLVAICAAKGASRAPAALGKVG